MDAHDEGEIRGARGLTSYIPHNSSGLFLRLADNASTLTVVRRPRHRRPAVREPGRPPPVTHQRRCAVPALAGRSAGGAGGPPAPRTPATLSAPHSHGPRDTAATAARPVPASVAGAPAQRAPAPTPPRSTATAGSPLGAGSSAIPAPPRTRS